MKTENKYKIVDRNNLRGFKFVFGFSFLLFFLLVFNISLSSAITTNFINLTQVQTKGLVNHGSAGLIFDNTGLKLFAFEKNDSDGNVSYKSHITQYNLTSPYDISTLSLSGIDISYGYGLDMDSDQLIYAGYITRDGNNMYLLTSNTTALTEPKTFNLTHYYLNNWNLSTLVREETIKFVVTSFGISNSPVMDGVYVSNDGNSMITTGQYSYSIYNGASAIANYNISNFNISNALLLNTGGVSQQRPYGAIAFSPDEANCLLIYQFNLPSLYGDLNNTLPIYQRDCHSHSISDTTDFASSRGGYIAYYPNYLNAFYFTESGGTLIKYQITGLSTLNTTIALNQSDTGLLATIISPLNGWFPDASTLDFKTKFGFVIGTMIIVAVILLVISNGKDGVPHLMLYLIGFVETGLIFYFVAIGYISMLIIILGALVLIAIAFFRFKGNGGGK